MNKKEENYTLKEPCCIYGQIMAFVKLFRASDLCSSPIGGSNSPVSWFVHCQYTHKQVELLARAFSLLSNDFE